ncbi:hypothetical protein ACF1GW_12530 [Streptomyces achromogenes]|uniref:hypothetical protein n=1 Tax=Streptomyces achromogenes TaxID=67255 RepID=UPI0036FA5ECD
MNAVTPGPADAGYATGEAHAAVAARAPTGYRGAPDDPAWPATDEAGWTTGEVVDSEGGVRR